MAAPRTGIEFSKRRPHLILTSQPQLHHSGQIFALPKELLAQKSAKIARQLQNNPHDDLSRLLCDIHTDQESMDLLARFCHGYEINLSAENVVRVACLANFLAMTDSHCPNNLLDKAISFFEKEIIHSWDNSIKAIKSAENVLSQAEELGLMDCCVETLILKALQDPRLLGEPLKKSDADSDDDETEKPYRPNTRRKLFAIEWKSEDLTTLPFKLYAPIIKAMIQRQVPPEYVAANVCQYAKTWILCNDDVPFDNISAQRETIEALIKLLPQQKGLLPCTFLCEMLRFAITIDANADCRNALELGIGMQLDQASAKDLLIPCQGYANHEKYDTDCLRRIVSNFYRNYTGPDFGALRSVADLIDEFLAEIAADIDLKTNTFLRVAEFSVAVSEGTQRSCDGIYRAIDVFLDKHRHLTESEKESLCGKVLDCNRLSGEALQHAAVNERLPMRTVVQVLFASQLKLRDAIPKAIQREEEEEEDEEEMRTEIEKMGSKVSKLERECFVMRREIAGGGGNVKKHKHSMWREMKRKFGCMTSMHDCDCHVKKKKVHPR